MVDSSTKLVVSAASQGGEGGGGDASLSDILAGLSSTQKTALLAAIGAPASPVVNTNLAGGFADHVLIAGGAAGDHTVAAIKVGDELDEVIYFIGAGVAVTDVSDLTAEFTIKAGGGAINNTGHTNTTGGKLLVRWTKLTAA